MLTSASRYSPTYLTPSPQLSPRPSSAFDEDTEVDDSTSYVTPDSSWASSPSPSPHQAMSAPPTLTDILLGVSSPPWTLSAFMAFLSQNHCMETLEFTMDTQRYATIYNQLSPNGSTSPASQERASSMWNKLMQTYIVPCAPREINIPARVRDQLLSLPSRPTSPHPSHLDEASRIIFELMNDSLLVPFLQSVCPTQVPAPGNDQLRNVQTCPAGSGHSRHTLHTSAPQKSHSAEPEGLTDDSGGNSPPLNEPMTPPTTPPTSEWGFSSSSSGGIRSAVAAHHMGWKKMGAKLGFVRNKTSRRSTPTSSGRETGDGGSL